MHGLIFETSIWLLAGSTRCLYPMQRTHRAQCTVMLQRCKFTGDTLTGIQISPSIQQCTLDSHQRWETIQRLHAKHALSHIARQGSKSHHTQSVEERSLSTCQTGTPSQLASTSLPGRNPATWLVRTHAKVTTYATIKYICYNFIILKTTKP